MNHNTPPQAGAIMPNLEKHKINVSLTPLLSENLPIDLQIYHILIITHSLPFFHK